MRRIQVLLLLVNAFLIRATHSQFDQYRTFDHYDSSGATNYYRLPPEQYHPSNYHRRVESSSTRGNNRHHQQGRMRRLNSAHRNNYRNNNYKYFTSPSETSSRHRHTLLQSVQVHQSPEEDSSYELRRQDNLRYRGRENMKVRTRTSTKSGHRIQYSSDEDTLTPKYRGDRVRNPQRNYRRRPGGQSQSRIDRFRNHRRGNKNSYARQDHHHQMSTTTQSPTTTTTEEPFDVSDIKVPIAFLRMEYMISFTFLGLMYGLGFLVLFQSLVVPSAKIMVVIVYNLLKLAGHNFRFTVQDVLEQVPPQKK